MRPSGRKKKKKISPPPPPYFYDVSNCPAKFITPPSTKAREKLERARNSPASRINKSINASAADLHAEKMAVAAAVAKFSEMNLASQISGEETRPRASEEAPAARPRENERECI